MIAMHLLSFRYHVALNVLWLFLVLLCVDLKFVIMVFSIHTDLPSELFTMTKAVFRDSFTSVCLDF